MKFKALKIWQAILIVVGVIVLAVGGALLYVHFTQGLGPKKVFPNDISFVVNEEDQNYNAEKQQFEVIDDFSLVIGTVTEGVTEKELTLSFTNNFTEIANADGYITDGVITIPQKVQIGKEFTVFVNKATLTDQGYEFLGEGESCNFGGISNLFAKTSNNLILPTSTKIAVDAQVVKTQIQLFDPISGQKVLRENGSFKLTEDTELNFGLKFLPQNSKYVFSDQISGAGAREKTVFVEVVEGSENLQMINDENGIRFEVKGQIGSTAKIKAYTFKNSSEQLKFYKDHANETGEQLINSAIAYLSRQTDLAATEEVDVLIVEADISSFGITRTNDLQITTNKKFILGAFDSAENSQANASLGVYIKNKTGQNLNSMVKNVGLRVLKEEGEGIYIETDEVKVLGGKVVSISENGETKNYVLIKSDMQDLKNAYWELSSSMDQTSYKIEIALLLHNSEGEAVAGEKFYAFTEKAEIKANLAENNEVLATWQEGEGVEAIVDIATKLSELVVIPENNNYKKIAFFGYFEGLNQDEINQYYNVKSFNEYVVGETSKKLAEINGDELLMKKSIESFELYFAIIKTDAYGNILKNPDGTYQVSQMSNPINVRAIEIVKELNANLSIAEEYLYTDTADRSYYIMPAGSGRFNIEIVFENLKDAETFNDQKARLVIKAIDFNTNEEISDALEITKATGYEIIGGQYVFKYGVKIKEHIVSEQDVKMTFKVLFNNGIEDLDKELTIPTSDGGNNFGYLTAYKSVPDTINLAPEMSENYTITQAINEDGTYTISLTGREREIDVTTFNGYLTQITVKDKFDRDLTESNPISITSSNPNVITVVDGEINVIAGANGGCNLIITSGGKTRTIAFTSSSDTVTKIEWTNDIYNDANGSYTTQTENLDRVNVTKLGYSGNEITLSNLLKIYMGEGADVEINSNKYFFTINTNGLENKDKLFGTSGADKGMLSVTTEERREVYSNKITSSTKITKITVNYDFGSDFTLPLSISGDDVGIAISLNLKFESNIQSANLNLSVINYGEGKTKPQDNGDYIGTFAKFGINLNDAVAVTKKHVKTEGVVTTPNSGTLSWELALNKGISAQGEGIDGTLVSEENQILMFGEVYSAKAVEYVLYEVAENPYAYNVRLKLYVYPNFIITPNEGDEENYDSLNYLAIANGNAEPLAFSVERYVGTEDVPDLSYSVLGSDVVTIDTTSEIINFKKVEGGYLNLAFGETSKNFKVEIKNGTNLIKDYNNNDAVVDMSLNLDIYKQIATDNSWEYLTYDNQKRALISYNNASISLLPSLSAFEGYTLGLFAGGTYINKEANNTFSITRLGTNGIVANDEAFLDLYIEYSETEYSETKVAYLKMPIVISAVGKEFAYYDSYNKDSGNFDLAVLLGSQQTLEDNDIFATYKAGGEYTILEAVATDTTESDPLDTTTETRTEKIYYEAGVSATLSIVENVEYNGASLATITDDNKLKLNHLVGEDQFIVIEVKLNKNSYSFTYYYRVKVAPSAKIAVQYPYEGDVEYLNIDSISPQTIDVSDRFSIKNLEDEDLLGITSNNVISQVKVDGKAKEITKNEGKFSVDGVLSISFEGDIMTLSLYDLSKKIEVVITKTYDNVINGSKDYNFIINATNFDYYIDFSDVEDVDVDGKNATLTQDPYSSKTYNLTTMQKDSSNYASEVNTAYVETFVSFEYEQDEYTFSVTENILTISEERIGEIIKLTYDYLTRELKIEVSQDLTDNHIINIIFDAEIKGRDGIVIETRSNISTFTLTIRKSVKITEANTTLTGGKSGVETNSLISKVEKFDRDSETNNWVEQGTTNYDLDVTCKDDFVQINTRSKTFSTAMLKADQEATFNVTITIGEEYSFKITKTIKKSVTYNGGGDFVDNISNAPTFSYADINSGNYYAGKVITLPFNNYAQLITGTNINGTFSVEILSPVDSVNINTRTIDGNTGDITLATGNVSAVTSIIIPITVTYTYPNSNRDYTYEFCFKLSLTINPNVTAKPNYPKPSGNEELTYETVGTGTDAIYEITTDIKTFLLGSKNDLADANRVVYYDKDGEEISYGEHTEENLKITLSEFSNVVVEHNDTEITETNKESPLTGRITIDLGTNTSGEVTFAVTYNSVVCYYTLYVVNGDAYNIIHNYPVNTANDIETIYPDASDDSKIFANDRLVALNIPANLSNSYNGVKFKVEFYNEDGTYPVEEDGTYPVEFVMNTEKYKGKTIFIDAGKSLTGFTYRRILAGETDLSGSISVSTTERITVSYKTKTGDILINKDNISGSVTRTSEQDDTTTAVAGTPTAVGFNEYNISNLTKTETTYTATYTINVGENAIKDNGAYKFQLALDIDVRFKLNNDGTGDVLKIPANDHDDKYNLVDIAGIYKPSTGASLSAEDIKTGVSTTLTLYQGNASGTEQYNYWDSFITEHNGEPYYPVFSDTISKMNAGVKFLTYQEIKAGEGNDAKAWNYKLTGEGAGNYGNWIMLIYTYTSGKLSKTFYIMVHVTPDYEFSVDGKSITSQDEDGKSVSSNQNSPKEVNVNEGKYEIGITSSTLTVVETNIASSDTSTNWTYEMTANDAIDGVTYNTDLDKIKDSSNFTSISTEEPKVYQWEKTEGNQNFILTKYGANIFGTKHYKVKVSNEYGYEAYFYFDFKPENEQDPSILTNATTLNSAIENDTFDIGVQYEKLSIEELPLRLYSKDNTYSYDIGNHNGKWAVFGKGTNNFVSYLSEAEFVDDKAEAINYEGNSFKDQDEISSDNTTYTVRKYYTIASIAESPQAGIVLSGINAWGFDKEETHKELKTDKITNTDEKYTDASKMILQYVTIDSIKFYYKGFEVGSAQFNFVQVSFTENRKKYTGIISRDKFAEVTDFGIGKTIKLKAGETATLYYEDEEKTVSSADDLIVEYNEYNTLATNEDLKSTRSVITGMDDFVHRSVKNTNFTIPKLDSWVYSDVASLTGNGSNDRDTVSVTMNINLKYQNGADTETFTVSHNINISRAEQISREDKKVVADGEEITLSKYFDVKKKNNEQINNYSIIDDTLVVTLPAVSGGQNQSLTIGAKVTSSDGKIAKFSDYTISNTNSIRPVTHYISISKLLKTTDGKGYILEENDKITFTFSNYESNGDIEGEDTYQKFYAKYRGAEITTTESVDEGSKIKTSEQITITDDMSTDTINIESSALLSSKGYTTVIKSYVFSINGNNYRVEKEYIVTPALYKPGDMIDPTQNKIINVPYSESVTGGGYVVNFRTWANGLTYLKGDGVGKPPTATGGSGNLTGVKSKIYVEIGKETTAGTASINEDLAIKTSKDYSLNGNQTIQIYIYVKPSGVDGTYNKDTLDESSYYLLGSFRMIVVSPELTATSLSGETISVNYTNLSGETYTARTNKSNISVSVKEEIDVSGKKIPANAIVEITNVVGNNYTIKYTSQDNGTITTTVSKDKVIIKQVGEIEFTKNV